MLKQIPFMFEEVEYYANVHVISYGKDFNYFVSFIDENLKKKFGAFCYYHHGDKKLGSIINSNELTYAENSGLKEIIARALYLHLVN